MARSGSTRVTFNTIYFDTILKSAQIDAIGQVTAERAKGVARSTAPVDSGEYRDNIVVEQRESRYRRVWRVVGRDRKTLLIEARTGNLARALKAVKRQ